MSYMCPRAFKGPARFSTVHRYYMFISRYYPAYPAADSAFECTMERLIDDLRLFSSYMVESPGVDAKSSLQVQKR